MRGYPLRVAIATLVVALAAAVSIPPLIADDDRPPPSTTPDEPVGNFPGMRYERLPDDPGIPARAQGRARTVALSHPRVSAAVRGQRARVILVRAHDGDLAPGDPCRPAGCIDVTIYLYGTDEFLDVFVAGDRVVRVERGIGQPPLSEAERRAAHRLAEADPEVTELFDGRPHTHHDALAKPMWPPGVCDVHRCGTVVFMLGDLARTGIGQQLSVTVDLSARRIVARTQIECTPACRIGWSG